MTSSHNDCPTLPKSPTGIAGFDDITFGGLPRGRPTLVCGAAGCGKTLFATTFLVNGATRYGEPGLFMSFEERPEDLVANVASLGYDLDKLVAAEKIAIDHVRVERGEIEESGEYDLEGLFIRLGFAVDSIGAKRVVLDTIETLFAGLDDAAVLRSELRRLFSWLRDHGLTTLITGERGEGQLTRQGLEEYVSDCVILLDNRVSDQISTRRLRVVKYRGSAHGTNEYPFLVDAQGISVLPVTSADLSHSASEEVVPTGISGLDAMLARKGFFKGSSILVSGASGTGKTTVAACMLEAACKRGERCLAFLFEEGGRQVVRNARSIGLDLQTPIDAGLLRFEAARPTLFGLESHLARMHRDLDAFNPSLVVVDPISALQGATHELQSTLLRMVDMLRGRGVTAVFTSLRNEGGGADELGLSSLMDAWVKLVEVEANGERNRTLYLCKARGMSHSNQVREFVMSEHGVKVIDAYVGPAGVLTGTARLIQEARERAADLGRQQDSESRRREIERRKGAIERQIAELHASLEAAGDEEAILFEEERDLKGVARAERAAIASRRGAE